MVIEQIHLNSPLYQQERELRNQILLRPIGINDYGWEHLDPESYHFVAHEKNVVTGCVMLYPNPDNPNNLKLMQMAVNQDLQKQGIGKKLVLHIIEFAKSISAAEIYCSSRYDAIEFYQKFGFKTQGDYFEEVGVKHIKMSLNLVDS